MLKTPLRLAALAAALLSPPALADMLGIAEPPFVARPGQLELSGRLLVKPQTLDARLARGESPKQAQRRDAEARDVLAATGVVRHLRGSDIYVVEVPAGEDESSFAARLLASGDYAFAHPDWICSLVVVPNDPQFSDQWHHATVGSTQAWNYSTGAAQTIVAICDTGVDLDHPDLASHLVPGYNAPNNQPQASGGDVNDINGHGTNCAGTAAAIGNNGTGVAGMGWNLSIMPIRVTNNSGGGASMGNILGGAEWAIENGARVASCSYTGVQSAAVQASGAYIRSLGGLLCYAADNYNQNHSGFDWPDVIVVGATDQNDNKASFSSYGVALDVYAPGVDIRTTANGGGYSWATGTSFATPMVNGVLGVIWSLNPGFTSYQVEEILFQSCEDFGTPGDDSYWGHGRIDFAQAMADAAAASGPAAPVANDDVGGTVRNQAVRVDVLGNDVDINGDEISIASFSPTSGAGGTVTLSAGTGPDGRDELRLVPAPGFVGLDTFTYVAQDPGGLGDSAQVQVEVFDEALVRPADQPLAVAPQLRASYYVLVEPTVLPDFSQLDPYLEHDVPMVNFPSTSGAFATSGRADEVGAVFAGLVEVPTTGWYTFYVESDDGSRLWIGDQLVVDNDGLHGMVEQQGTILLAAGLHETRIHFFERFGGAGCIARISGGGLTKQPIPSDRWFRSVTPPCSADFDDNGIVDFTDLLFVLGEWGPCTGGCPYDLDGDASVGFGDLLSLLAAWGPCPE